MSFQEAVRQVRDVILENDAVRKILKPTLTRIGLAAPLDLRNCSDPNDVSMSFIPQREDEQNDTLTFDEGGRATIIVSYTFTVRLRYEKPITDVNNKPVDRIEDSNSGPGLLNLVRMVKSALGADYTEDLGDKIGRGINLKYLGVQYKQETPMVQADISLQISEEVEIGNRKATP